MNLGIKNVSVAAALVVALVGGGYAAKSLVEGGAATNQAVALSCPGAAPGWKGGVSGAKILTTHPVTETRLLTLINNYRVANGLKKVTLSVNLGYAARFHSADMQKKGYFDHGLFSQRLARYTPSQCIGENLAWGTGDFGRGPGILSLWKSSPAHRKVLLTPGFTRVGIGVRTGMFMGQKNATIATVDFSYPTLTSTPVPAPGPPPPPPVTTPPQPPVTTDTTPLPPGPPTGGSVVGVPYTCKGPVHNLTVRGTGSDGRALINLTAGCTGDMNFDIHVTSGGGDGVKVQGGVHDLNIGPSRIICDRLSNTSFHQDGVQVQGGVNVIFHGLQIICPFVTGQGAGGFYIDGKDFGGINNVVCDGCNLEHLHYGAMWTGPAVNSGIRNSIIHQGNLTHGYYAKLGNAAGAIDQNNTLKPGCDSVANC